MRLKFEYNEWLVLVILSIILLTDLSIFLNIPVLRQILGFLFLFLLPGLLILQILRLNEIGYTEKLVLSVGLSISFLMLFGLLINNLSLSLGYDAPLGTISLLISFNIVFVVLAIIGYKRNEKSVFSLPNFNLIRSEKAFLVVPIFFPALSILGAHLMKIADNNIIFIFLYSLISFYIVLVCFFNQKFSKRLYPVVIFSISLSLLLIFALRFPHISGHDVHNEYGFYFLRTLENLHWSMFGHYSTLDACLSISILPAIFQSIMNATAQEYLFKAVYVSICSFTPLAVYVISKKYVGELYAFLASFFFMTSACFLAASGSPRTNVAIFFVALVVMVFFSDKIYPLKRRLLFIVFIVSMVISHYSTTYIFFFITLATFVGTEILFKRYTFKKSISLTFVLLFFAFIFFWYSQIVATPFKSGIMFVETTFLSLNQLFIEESKSALVPQLVGKGINPGIFSKVTLAFTWGVFIFIGIGVLTLIKRYKEVTAISNVKLKKPDFLKEKFEVEYLVMILACSGLLIIMVVLPYVSKGYGIGRLYGLVVIILSVCFVIGGMTLSKQTFKKSLIKNFSFKKKALPKKQKGGRNGSQDRAYLVILLLLIPYFLLSSGVIPQIFGMSSSDILNSEGVSFDKEYIHDSESYSAKWLENNVEERSMIYTGEPVACFIFTSQARILGDRRLGIVKGEEVEGYIYLGYYNIIGNKLIIYQNSINAVIYNMTECGDIFVEKNRIYSNGESEVWR